MFSFFLPKSETWFSIFQYAAIEKQSAKECIPRKVSLEKKLFLNCGKNAWWMKLKFFSKKCHLCFYNIWSFHCQKQLPEVFCKKDVVKNLTIFMGKTCVGVSLIKLQGWRPATLLKKYSNTQVFSCEIWKTFKKTYFEEHLQTTASAAQVLFTDFQQKCITTIFRTLFNVFTTFVVV